MRVFDAVIVGGGPAGSALAIHLAREGVSVLLLEKGRFPRDKVCGDFVSPKGLRSLRDLGCWDEIARRGFTRIHESVVYLNGRKLSGGRLPHLHGHPPFGHAVPRNELDEIIFRRAQAAGAETVEGCSVTGFHTSTQVVCVEAVVAGQRRRFAGRMLVGADGANSTVARAAGLAMTDRRYVLASVRAYCSGAAFDRTILYFDEDFFPGFGWIFPVRGDVSNVGVGMVKEPMTRHGIRLRDFYERFKRFVIEIARSAGSRVQITPTAGWPIKTYGGTHRSHFDRGILIGEAACFVDPISGEGIPLALESAEMARDVVLRALDRGAFDSDALSEWEDVWRSRYDPDLMVSDLVVSIIRNRHLVKLWLRSLKVMGMTAWRDPDYALKTGGILAGLVPNRDGFDPDVVLKSLVHGPTFWMNAFGISPRSLLPDLLERGAATVVWETALARDVVEDFEWFCEWVREVGAKQRAVMELLARAPRPTAPSWR